MRIHRILAMCACAASFTFGATASADDDALSDTARELFVKGVKAYDQSKWDQCRAALLAAFAIKHHAQVAGNLADCELKLGMHRDAAEHAWFFLHALRPDAPAERRTAAEALLKAAQQKVATMRIVVDVEGAEVLVDGQSAGKTPLAAPVFVEPGRHTVEALRAGDVGAQVSVDAGAGETREVTLALKTKQAPVPTPPVERRPLWPVFTGAGVTVVAVGAGIGLAVAAAGKRSAGDALRMKLGSSSACVGAQHGSPDCTAMRDAVHARDALSDGAFGSFVAGAVAAAATVGLGAWAAAKPKAAERRESRLRILPVVTVDGGGVLVRGTW
jgi:hypothetical protein